jgi:[acyl-carrier-protein] S-malonyltransferase
MWEESIKAVASSGVKSFYEIGPGQVLKGLLKKIDPKLEVKNIGGAADLSAPVQTGGAQNG